MTDAGRGGYRTGPASVTCLECGIEIPPDDVCVVRGVYEHYSYYCWPCADASPSRAYRIPWLSYGAREAGRTAVEYVGTCPRCGRRFIGVLARVYCSATCGEATRAARRDRTSDRQARPCQTCGDSFTPPRDDARYCSPACRQKSYRQRRNGAGETRHQLGNEDNA